MPEDIQQALFSEMQDLTIMKNKYISKQGETAKYIYLVTRGQGSEFNEDLKNIIRIKRSVGDIINYH